MNENKNVIRHYLINLDSSILLNIARDKGIVMPTNVQKEEIVEEILSKTSDADINIWYNSLQDEDMS